MDHLTKLFVKIRERTGQSMTEYALIMAAIAVVAYASYLALGKGVVSIVANVTANL